MSKSGEEWRAEVTQAINIRSSLLLARDGIDYADVPSLWNSAREALNECDEHIKYALGYINQAIGFSLREYDWEEALERLEPS